MRRSEGARSRDFVLPRLATRMLVGGGFVVGGWLLGATLCGGASAAELPSGPDSTATQVTEAPAVSETVGATSTDGLEGEPGATFWTGTDSTGQAGRFSLPEQGTPAVQHRAAWQAVSRVRQDGPDGDGLLGGLLGSVSHAFGGLFDGVRHTVPSWPGSPMPSSSPLTGIADILPMEFAGMSASGGVTVTVPAAVAVTPQTVAAMPAVAAPATVPAPVASQPTRQAEPVASSLPHRDAFQQGPLRSMSSDMHAGQPGDSGSGGVQPPAAPGAPAGGSTSATSPHDGGSGGRHPLAMTTSTQNRTQLRLIGTSRDPSVDGAGREAALPTTSPD